MTTLVEPGRGSEPEAQNAPNTPDFLDRRGDEAGGWGLLLVPVLLCIAMVVFALVTAAGPAPEGVAASRSCSSSPESGPVADC